MALWLSQWTFTCSCLIPSSVMNPLSQIASFIPSVIAINYASVVENATTNCSIDFQHTTVPKTVNTNPVSDFPVSKFPEKLESMNPTAGCVNILLPFKQ